MKLLEIREELFCPRGHLNAVLITYWKNRPGTDELFDVKCHCGDIIDTISAYSEPVVTRVEQSLDIA